MTTAATHTPQPARCGADELIWSLDEPEATDEPPCKGLVFRCRESYYKKPSTGAYVHSVEFVPLTRMSCTGCDKCGWMGEYLQEVNSEIAYEDASNGELYTLSVTDTHIDWETGMCDDVTLGFVRVAA